MRRPTSNKRGLLAPTPAAQITALDFAHAAEAFDRAARLCDTPLSETEMDAASDATAALADRLLSIPAREPAAVAKKIEAFAWSTGVPGLNDPAERARIAASSNDHAKGLLAIHMDVSAMSAAPVMFTEREAWDAAVARWVAACEAKDAADAQGPVGDAATWDAAFEAWCDAWEAVIDAPAPDAAAMLYKLRLILNHSHEEELEDTPDDPAFYQRLLNNGLQNGPFPLVRLLQDASRISGVPHPAATLKRERRA